MNLQKKILLFFLPTIFFAIALFGFWASRSTEKELRNTVAHYLQGVLSTYVSENVQAQYNLLTRNGLDTIPSYIARYQESVLEDFAKIKLIWPGHFFVFTDDGNLVACTSKHNSHTMADAWWKLVDSLQLERDAGRIKTGYNDYANQKEFYGLIYFAPWKWHIGVAIDASTISNAALEIRIGTLFFALLSGIFISIISFFLLRTILLKPIYLIKEAAKAISQEVYPKSIEVHSRDELGDLARDVINMSVRIEENTAELVNLNRGLEQQVNQRTEELKKKNELLSFEVEEHKKTEETLLQKTQELEHSNRNLEDFAYVASHDLQEPLRMVSSFTQLLSDKYGGKLDEDARKYIWYATDGASRMQQLIQDLLQFSRISTQGKEFVPIDSKNIVEQAMTNLKQSIEESVAQIRYGDLPRILGDAGQLRQVFQNLIGNSLKFRGEAPPKIDISAKKEGDSWIFSISDNGIGFDPQHSEQIFSIFKRLHTREEYQGTGIGLSICKRIIERHGGNIWVSSEIGKGTTFYFSI